MKRWVAIHEELMSIRVCFSIDELMGGGDGIKDRRMNLMWVNVTFKVDHIFALHCTCPVSY